MHRLVRAGTASALALASLTIALATAGAVAADTPPARGDGDAARLLRAVEARYRSAPRLDLSLRVMALVHGHVRGSTGTIRYRADDRASVTLLWEDASRAVVRQQPDGPAPACPVASMLRGLELSAAVVMAREERKGGGVVIVDAPLTQERPPFVAARLEIDEATLRLARVALLNADGDPLVSAELIEADPTEEGGK